MEKYFFSIVMLLLISCKAWGCDKDNINSCFVLLTKDYGILKKNDMAANVNIPGNKKNEPPPIAPKVDPSGLYWQCFPREDITLTLEDIGESSEDLGWKENYGNLTISVLVETSSDNHHTDIVQHEYGMRRMSIVSGEEFTFHQFQKLMEHQKYVCLAGGFVNRIEKTEKNGTRQIYYWIFEKIKTKKGCHSYFEGGCS